MYNHKRTAPCASAFRRRRGAAIGDLESPSDAAPSENEITLPINTKRFGLLMIELGSTRTGKYF